MRQVRYLLVEHRLAPVFLTAVVVSVFLVNGVLVDFRQLAAGRTPRFIDGWEKPRPLLRLEGDETHFQRGFWGGYVGPGMDFAPVSLGKNFTVELVVKPFPGQAAYAHIVGNHPGFNYYEGFALQQDGAVQESYTFGFGNGCAWLPAVKVKIPEGRRSYLAFVVKNGTIRAYRNGVLVAFVHAGGDMRNSGMPLSLGNWANKDRPFHGLIYEARISRAAMTQKDIHKNQLLWGGN